MKAREPRKSLLLVSALVALAILSIIFAASKTNRDGASAKSGLRAPAGDDSERELKAEPPAPSSYERHDSDHALQTVVDVNKDGLAHITVYARLNDNPVPDVMITFWSASTADTAVYASLAHVESRQVAVRTDAAGSVQVELDPGFYFLTAEDPQRRVKPLLLQRRLGPGSVQTIDLQLIPFLESTFYIQVIRESDAVPVVGAEVSFYLADLWNPNILLEVGITGVHGIVKGSFPSSSRVIARVVAEGYAVETVALPGVGSVRDPRFPFNPVGHVSPENPFQIHVRQYTSANVLVNDYPANSHLKVKVVRSDSEFESPECILGIAEVDDFGTCRIDGLPSNLALTFAAIDPSERLRSCQVTLSLLPDQDNAVILKYKASARVRGTVYDSGKPAGNVEVVISPAVGSMIMTGSEEHSGGKAAFTDAQGVFEFRDVAPGNWLIVAQDSESRSAYRGIAIEDELEVSVQLVLDEGATLQGTVVDRQESPVANASVYCTDAEGVLLHHAYTGIDGQFKISVPLDPRGYRLEAGTRSLNYRLVEEGLRCPWSDTIDVKAGASGIRLLLAPEGRLVGRLVRITGEREGSLTQVFAIARDRSSVVAEPALFAGATDGPLSLEWTSCLSTDGSFAFGGLVPGDYVVICSNNDGEVGIADVAVAAGASATVELTLADNALISNRLQALLKSVSDADSEVTRR